MFLFVFFQAEDGIRDLVRSRGLGDVYKRQILASTSEGLILTEVSSGKTIRQWKLNDSQPRVIATNRATGPVSYTHLTLPTSDLV